MKLETKVRINLHVYALDNDSTLVYWPLHIGFFPESIVPSVVDSLNARGIAFHSDIKYQTGLVEVVTCNLNPLDGMPTDTESVVRSLEYGPPRDRSILIP